MASEYTPNRRYPLYTDSDKPNLRDQYNGAIREIDTDMAQALQDSSGVASALGAGFDAQHTVRMAIEELQAEDDSLSQRILDRATKLELQAEVSAREAADESLSQRILDRATKLELQAETSAREAADTSMGNRIASVESELVRNAIYVGNSYALGTGSTGGNNGLYERTKSVFDSSELLWESGIGFGQYSGHITTFLTLLQTKAANMTSAQKQAITDIVAISAVGDDRIVTQFDSATLRSYMEAFSQFVKNTFPNAKMWVFLCSSNASAGQGDVTPKTVGVVMQRFHASCAQFGMIYGGYVGYYIARNSSFFSSDGYHPSDTGYEYMAGLIRQVLTHNAYANPFFARRGSTLLSDASGQSQVGVPLVLWSNGDNGINAHFGLLNRNSGDTIAQEYVGDVSDNGAYVIVPALTDSNQVPKGVCVLPDGSTQPFAAWISSDNKFHLRLLNGPITVQTSGTCCFISTAPLITGIV